MGKPTGFLEFERADRKYEPVDERVKHWHEFVVPLPETRRQGPGRALHGLRHPLLSHRLPGQQPDPRLERPRLSGRLEAAAQNLHSTNNFPEVTGRVCPAPCEAVLHAQHRRRAGHHQDHRVRHRRPRLRARAGSRREPPEKKTGKKIAIIGSGPAASPPPSSSRAPAMTCTSTRRAPSPAACCVYGIPDFKMEKGIIDARA